MPELYLIKFVNNLEIRISPERFAALLIAVEDANQRHKPFSLANGNTDYIVPAHVVSLTKI